MGDSLQVPLRQMGGRLQITMPDKTWMVRFDWRESRGRNASLDMGKEGVVMISDEQYDRLVGKSHQPKNLVQFFRESLLVGIELNLDRAQGYRPRH